jgi:GGDEF domain-containing protein
MTARPPRASTRSDGKAEAKSEAKADGKADRSDARRVRTRGATQPERVERIEKTDKRRVPSVLSTDRYERITDDEVLEVTDLAAPGEPPRLRLLVLETAPHLATAQGAIVAAGHAVALGVAGREGLEKARAAIGEVDAMLLGMPGGEPLIDAALALGARRPIVIAAWTAGAVEAARRSAGAGADLATVRPHHVERLAPLLLAAGRLIESRRQAVAPPTPAEVAEVAEIAEIDLEPAGERDLEADPEPAGLLPAELFAQAVSRELDRARRYGYPFSVAMFVVDVAPPPPPPGLRGILRARAGNALVHALRDIDLATELDQERFLVVMPHTDRAAAAELARRIIGAVATGDPVIAAGRTFPPRVIGAVAGAPPGEALDLPRLVRDVTQLLEQAQVTGASLAVDT